jgi:hypothetical protein
MPRNDDVIWLKCLVKFSYQFRTHVKNSFVCKHEAVFVLKFLKIDPSVQNALKC